MSVLIMLGLLFLNLFSSVIIKLSSFYDFDLLVLTCLVFALIIIYVLRTVFWLLIGRYYQLSFIYPVLGINYVLSFFVGVLIFDEPFRLRRLVASVIILCGVILLTFSKEKEQIG